MTPQAIAHYRITAKLGKGGMGEVYRATDTKLDREVAIKVLPEGFATDPGRMVRFEREAKLLASLNHPNIAHIYGVEENALVMELVEGESPKGPLPFDDAWKIALQIADALEYAHERGVIHRDLKPANVKVTPDGVVKLLDFGLAKAFSPDAGEAQAQARATDSPTVTLGATVAGTIMGTAAYMAPEQARGKRVDKRADIWSWGVVLYELLMGERLFKGEDTADTLAAVIHKEPDLSKVPARVRKLLGRCLEKDPKRRLRDIGEAHYLLDEPAPNQQTGTAQSRLGWVFAAVFSILAVGLGWIAWRGTRPVERPLMQLNVDLGKDVTPVPSGWGPQVVLSPDGSLLTAAVRDADGQRRLGIWRLDQDRITLLPGTEGAAAPFFSRDGKWIAFRIPGTLKKVSPEGGAPVKICDACYGGDWGDDGSIVTMPGVGTGIGRISPDGGSPTLVTQIDTSKQEFAHRWPQVLPGSQAILFTVYGSDRDYDDSEIDVVSLKTGKRKAIYQGGFYARYLPSGHLVFIHQNTLFAAPFDLTRLKLGGTPQPVLGDILNGPDDGADFDFSQNGTVVYVSNERTSKRSIFWLDGAGHTQLLQPGPGLYRVARFSPNAKQLAFSLDDGQGHTDIWVRDLDRGTTRRVTSLPGRNDRPMWMPDSSAIIFVSTNPAAPGFYWMRSDGSGEPERMADRTLLYNPAAVSPDGKSLAALRAAEAPGNGGAIWMTPIEGEPSHPKLGSAKLWLNSAISPAFSPDGRWVAYLWQVPGKTGVWVRPFRGPGGPWLVDSDGASPVWPSAGHELFYISLSTRKMMAAGYSVNGDSFSPEKPRVWSDKRLIPSLATVGVSYDIAPDGKRFAVLLGEDGTAQEKPITHVTFLLNFFDYLRQRVPVTK
jgi:serine/threonine-protein kinase